MPLQFPSAEGIQQLMLAQGQRRAELAQRLGQIQAEQQARNGEIWGRSLAQLGQLPTKFFEQRAADQELKLRQQQLQMQQEALKQKEIDRNYGIVSQAAVGSFAQALGKQNDDGTYSIDPGQMAAKMQEIGTPLALQEQTLKQIDLINKSNATLKQAQLDHAADQANMLLQLPDDQLTPQSVQIVMAANQMAGTMTPQDAAKMSQILQQAGGNVRPVLESIRNLSPKYAQEKPVTVAPGASLVNPVTGKPVFQAPERPVSVAPGSSLMNPATGQIMATAPGFESSGQAKDVMLNGKPAIVTYDPKTKRFTDAQGADVTQNVAPMPPARVLYPAPPGSVAGGTGALTPEGVDYAATIYRLTNKMPSLGMGSREEKAAIINAASAQAKALGQSPAAAFQRQAAIKADTGALNKMTSMQAAAQGYEVKALQQADLVEQFSQKVPRTNIPLLNKALVTGQAKIAGDPNAQQLINSIVTFSNEYAKIMEGSTGSASAVSDSARRAADRLINEGLTKGQMTAVLGLMKREMELTMNGYDAAIGSIQQKLGESPAGVSAPSGGAGTPPAGARIRVWQPDGTLK